MLNTLMMTKKVTILHKIICTYIALVVHFNKFDLRVTRDELKAMQNSKSLILCGNVG